MTIDAVVERVDLARQMRAELHWMQIANHVGMGLYGPSLKRDWKLTIPACERLTACGFATTRWGSRKGTDFGYWITPLGRKALTHIA